MPNHSFDRVSFGEFLTRAGLVTTRHVRDALDLQEREGGSLGTNLLAIRAIDESSLLRALGAYHSSPTVSAGELQNIPWQVLRAVSLDLVRQYSIVPFRVQGNTICVASRRPGSIAIENEIVLDDPSHVVSRLHAELQPARGGYVLVDRDSDHGVWVDGERVERVTLEPGVPVVIGPYQLSLEGWR